MGTDDGRRVYFLITLRTENLEGCPTGRTVVVFKFNREKTFRAKILITVNAACAVGSQSRPTAWTIESCIHLPIIAKTAALHF
jgi:hypothetical protein